MKYDISTIENCFKTMRDMTNYQYWEDIFPIYSFRFINEPDRMREEIMKRENIQLKDISKNDISFVLLHVTTSAEDCKGIRKDGLHDLVWTYNHETELRKFLDKCNVNIDIDNRKIMVNGIVYEMQDNIKEAGGVGYKFFNDSYICGCFQLNKGYPYGGQVHIRPEIIYNINRIIKGKNLEYEWKETHKDPYVIKFNVPLRKMNIALGISMKDKKEAILQTMFNYAFNTIFYNDFSSNYIGILKRDEYVPPEDILSIEKY